MNSKWEKECLNIFLNIREQNIKNYLKELDISDEDMKFYQELQNHLKEGIIKHPDEPGVENSVAEYGFIEWKRDLHEEFFEVFKEVNYKNMRIELFHLMIVARRMIKYIDQYLNGQRFDP